MEQTTLVPNHERRHRRRGLLVFALIGSSVAMIGAGAMSLALFTDAATTDGTFATGTIDINATPATALFNVAAMMPGDSQSATLNVANGGSAQLRYAMTSATTAGSAALAGQLTLTVKTGTCAGATIYSGTLAAAAFGSTASGNQAGDRTLNPSPTNEDLCFTVTLPGGVATGNAFQGLSTTQTFTFTAEQTAGNNESSLDDPDGRGPFRRAAATAHPPDDDPMYHRPSLLSAARWAVDGALMLLVVIAFGTLVVSRLLPALGLQTVVITGRSMEPAIRIYSVVVLESVGGADIGVGDIVTITIPDSHLTYTHRVEEVIADQAGPLLRTHGDANMNADATLIPTAWVKGRAVATLPALGYPLRLASAPTGVLFVASLSVWLFVLGRLLDDVAWERRLTRRALIAQVLADSERALRVQPEASIGSFARGGAAIVIGVALVAAIAAPSATSSAIFTDSVARSGSVTTNTLDAPTSVAASVAGLVVTLTWTASTDAAVSTGYQILRSTTSGSGYVQVGTKTPATATSTTDTAPAIGTYYYVLRTYAGAVPWVSANSNQATAATQTNTGFKSCASNAAVPNPNNGDGNGYQTNPAEACDTDGTDARDTNSGTTTSTSCSDTGKDRHNFWTFGLGVPVAVTSVDGIEVHGTWEADSAAATPSICIRLSYDGGANWTAYKQLAITNAPVVYTLGTTSDKWGRTWSGANLSDANFRVQVVDVAANVGRDFRLDALQVRVTYTL